MKNLENKKYPVLMILTGFFGIILVNILANNYYLIAGNLVPVDYIYGSNNIIYENVKGIDLGFFVLGLKKISSLFILIIACSVYLFLYKTDEEIKFYLIRIKDKILIKRMLKTSFSSYKGIESTEIHETEKTEKHIKLEKIQTLKSHGLLYGLIILVIQIVLYLILKENVAEYSMQIIINFSISLILRFFSAYKCNELSEYNKGSSNKWFLFGIMFPSIALIVAGMDFSIKKEWEDYQHIVSTTSEKKINYNPISKYPIYLIIIILILVSILYFKNPKSSEKQVENFEPELLDTANINTVAPDTNIAVAPDTAILNDIKLEELKKGNAISKEDSISGAKLRESLLNLK